MNPALPPAPQGDPASSAPSRSASAADAGREDVRQHHGFVALLWIAALAQYGICAGGGYWATGGNYWGAVAMGLVQFTAHRKAQWVMSLGAALLMFAGGNAPFGPALRRALAGDSSVASKPSAEALLARMRLPAVSRRIVVGSVLLSLLATVLFMGLLLLLTVPVAIGFALFAPDPSAWSVMWRLLLVAAAASLLCWPTLQTETG